MDAHVPVGVVLDFGDLLPSRCDEHVIAGTDLVCGHGGVPLRWFRRPPCLAVASLSAGDGEAAEDVPLRPPEVLQAIAIGDCNVTFRTIRPIKLLFRRRRLGAGWRRAPAQLKDDPRVLSYDEVLAGIFSRAG
jgi:hypothetical protein